MGITTKLPMNYDIKLMLRHSTCYAMIGYKTHYMIIFFNNNVYVRNERKNDNKIKGVTYKITHFLAVNIPRQLHVVLT